jgi:hypothetical protein
MKSPLVLSFVFAGFFFTGMALLFWPNPSDEEMSYRTVPPQTQDEKTCFQPSLQFHDFGKLLVAGDRELTHTFTFTNTSESPVELGRSRSYPSCCVTFNPKDPSRTRIEPGESFDATMRVRLSPVAGRFIWRGFLETSHPAKAFGAEAVGEVHPVMQARWLDDESSEVDKGESSGRSGVVSIISAVAPTPLEVQMSDQGDVIEIGGFRDRGAVAGTSYRVWECPVRVQGVARKAGPAEATAVFHSTLPSCSAQLKLNWRVRSDWVVEPTVATLTAESGSAKFAVTSRRRVKTTAVRVSAPSSLAATVSATAPGLVVEVRSASGSPKRLEWVTLAIDDEELRLPVVSSSERRVVAETRP